MPRPRPTRIYHLTHVDHLPTVVERGLLCDAEAAGMLRTEVGNRDIKAQRRARAVRRGPGGTVADYVPFYFAPRSPMLYAIKAGNVDHYKGGQEPLVYLVSEVERLVDLGLRVVCTDRNAALEIARHSDDLEELETLVDWALMEELIWTNTEERPDRRERRMAECLVHDRVPWEAFLGVATMTPTVADHVSDVLRRLDVRGHVAARPDWYFE